MVSQEVIFVSPTWFQYSFLKLISQWAEATMTSALRMPRLAEAGMLCCWVPSWIRFSRPGLLVTDWHFSCYNPSDD